MNRKQFGILVVLLIVLGGAGLILRRGQNSESSAGERGAGQKLLGENFPLNDVAQISIKAGTNEVNLVRKDDLWRVRERNDYPANFADISSFLLKARDLKVVQVEQVGPSQLGRFELAPSGQGKSGVVLDLKDKDGKAIKSLILGKKHVRKPQGAQAAQFGDEGFPDGRYVMLAGKAQDALLIGDPLSNVEPNAGLWLKKDFFHVERPKAIAVTFPVATNSWKIVKDTESGDWKFADAKADEKLDSTKASGVANPFSSPMFNDVVSAGAKPEDNGLDKPTVVTVESFDDLTYTVNVGKKAGEEYPITMTVAANFPKERIPAKDEKPEDKDKADKAWKERQKQIEDKLKETKAFEKWTYLVPGYSVDPILKERKDLLEEKKDEKKDATPTADKADAVTGIPDAAAGKN
jgi:hypothetical protein